MKKQIGEWCHARTVGKLWIAVRSTREYNIVPLSSTCQQQYMRIRTFITLIAINIAGLPALCQYSYTDSILNFQQAYKKDLFSIIQTDTSFVRFYTIDSSYKIMAAIEKLNGQVFFAMGTSDGKAKQARKFAKLTFNREGKEYILFAYQLSTLLSSDTYKNNFFIPFTDATSGVGSYAGGKYIDFLTTDIIAGRTLLIDFNKSYNPYCAFRAGYSCPVPPKENELPLEIKAGEMNFGKRDH